MAKGAPPGAAKAQARVDLPWPVFHATTRGPADCEATPVFSSLQIDCGGEDHAAASVTLAEASADSPQSPAAVLQGVQSSLTAATVKETARHAEPGGFHVEYVVAPLHGVATLGFTEVRTFGSKKLSCSGTAFTAADLSAMSALCSAVVPVVVH